VNEEKKEIRSQKWMRLDRYLKQALIPAIIVLVLYPVVVIAGADESPFEEWLGGRRNFLLLYIIVLPPCSLYIGALYKIRKDKWVKLFEIGNDEIIGIIAHILEENNLPFRRLSENEKLPGFPISFAEIFEIDNGRINIGVQRVKSSYSAVDIGPIGGEDTVETLGIDVLREKIDGDCEIVQLTND